MLYHTVEERAIVVAIRGQFQEIITMLRGLVIKSYADIAQRSLNQYFCHIFYLFSFIFLLRNPLHLLI